jgi:predicted MFS family arabinose efflux permease
VQIGVLQTLQNLVAIVGPPFWGAVADRIRNQRVVHVACIVSGTLLLFVLQYFYWSFNLTMLVVLVANFQMSPAGSMLDHAILALLDRVGGEYGKQRLFGAVGWGLCAYLTGLVVAVGGISWAFNANVIVGLSSLLVLRLIPPIRYEPVGVIEAMERGRQEDAAAAEPSFLDNARRICRRADVLVLIGVVLVTGLMYGVLSSFLTLNLYNLSGENPQIIGVAIMCETISELPAFFYSHTIIKKLGTVGVLLVSIAGYAVRITYYAVMPNAWSAIPFEFLHGCTFALSWAACTEYLYSASPKGCEGTVIGILNGVQNGLARAVGTIMGGYFYEVYGPRTMWWITDLGVPLSLIGVAAFAYLKEEDQPEEEEEEAAPLVSPHEPSYNTAE